MTSSDNGTNPKEGERNVLTTLPAAMTGRASPATVGDKPVFAYLSSGTALTPVPLLRGINVGGRNKVPMGALRERLESHGHSNVSTYIASGNVILRSGQSIPIRKTVEA